MFSDHDQQPLKLGPRQQMNITSITRITSWSWRWWWGRCNRWLSRTEGQGGHHPCTQDLCTPFHKDPPHHHHHPSPWFYTQPMHLPKNFQIDSLQWDKASCLSSKLKSPPYKLSFGVGLCMLGGFRQRTTLQECMNQNNGLAGSCRIVGLQDFNPHWQCPLPLRHHYQQLFQTSCCLCPPWLTTPCLQADWYPGRKRA